jgi:hypothetical protein
MRKILIPILLLLGLKVCAQNEVLKCDAIDPVYKLETIKVTSDGVLKSLKPAYPFYIVDTINMLKIKKVHSLVTSQKNEISELRKQKSYYSQLENQNDTLQVLITEQKILYQDSYNQILAINKQLSSEFDKVYNLSVKQAKKAKMNSVLVGILSGLVAGITTGLILK